MENISAENQESNDILDQIRIPLSDISGISRLLRYNIQNMKNNDESQIHALFDLLNALDENTAHILSLLNENLEREYEDRADLAIPKQPENPASTGYEKLAGKKILVVDDIELNRVLLSLMLKNIGMEVVEAENGHDAIELLQNSKSDEISLSLMDIMMPVMDGMTLCQKLKSNFNTNHIPVVLMTALGSDADRIAGISNGADAYVSKPFNIDVLRTTVIQLLKTRQILQGKYHGDKQSDENIDKVEMESPDEHLMKRVMKVINENMDNSELSVEIIADKVGISRVHFYRKMKDLTGQAPRDFVKYVRLKEAARLLAEKKYDITGVSVATGFKSLSAFSTQFKALYGLTPSEWLKNSADSDHTKGL